MTWAISSSCGTICLQFIQHLPPPTEGVDFETNVDFTSPRRSERIKGLNEKRPRPETPTPSPNETDNLPGIFGRLGLSDEIGSSEEVELFSQASSLSNETPLSKMKDPLYQPEPS
ncbi:hypothetical protein BJX61DRAFT_382553 [Aspergillus egyptiacus]|nr:hypothetical protein BJX61DRAFT_382553 [Aspergillus egyptiacus]